jgi:hypothetical protein
MSTLPKALRLADALDELDRQFSRNGLCGDAAAELRRLHEALETEQEPVAWITDGGKGELWWYQSSKFDEEGNLIGPNQDDIPLYTAPPKKQWVGLTEREVELIDEMIETQLLHAERCDHMANSTMAQKQKAWDLERVELLRKLKERNG